MIATITDKGQLTLPKPIRDLLGIRAGSRIDFEVQPDNTLRARVMTRGAAGLHGLLARPGQVVKSLEEMDDAIASVAADRARRKP